MARRLWVGMLGGVLVALSAVVVTAGPAGANAVCGQAISSGLTLTHDLTCSGNGLNITASNVVLDLGGHTLTGTIRPEGQPGTSGVLVQSGRPNVTIRNGTIRGFNRGVSVNPGAIGTLISGLTIDSNALGIGVFADTTNGVVAQRSRIINNHITTTTQFAGIQLAGNGHMIQANTVTNTAGNGIQVHGDDNLVSSNTIADSGRSGISVGPTPSDPGPFERNRIMGNRISGSDRLFNSTSLSIRSASNTVIEGNTVVGRRTSPGIFIDQSTNTTLRGNTATDHSTGISVRSSSGTNLVQNRVTQNNFSGIFVDATATNTLVDRNVASDNGQDGIKVASPSTVITANTAYFNGALGIRAVAGVTDGGGNRAFGNGNPAQCSPTITCTS